MPLISTSQDILFLVLAFCALWITVLIAWLLYYVISLTRNIHAIFTNLKRMYQTIGNKVSSLKDKVDIGSSAASFIASQTASIIAAFLKTKSTSNRKNKN